jgi:anti-sigma B factor antagonist
MDETKELKIEVDRRGRLAVVSVAGQVVRDNQVALRNELERLVLDGVTELAVDLSQVSYMDSAGLGCCSSIQKLLSENRSGAIAVFGATENVERTWILIRLDSVIPVFSDRAAALEWLHHRG